MRFQVIQLGKVIFETGTLGEAKLWASCEIENGERLHISRNNQVVLELTYPEEMGLVFKSKGS